MVDLSVSLQIRVKITFYFYFKLTIFFNFKLKFYEEVKSKISTSCCLLKDSLIWVYDADIKIVWIDSILQLECFWVFLI